MEIYTRKDAPKFLTIGIWIGNCCQSLMADVNYLGEKNFGFFLINNNIKRTNFDNKVVLLIFWTQCYNIIIYKSKIFYTSNNVCVCVCVIYEQIYILVQSNKFKYNEFGSRKQIFEIATLTGGRIQTNGRAEVIKFISVMRTIYLQ